ncbi:MAG: GAF domain-containing protein [Planctomycetes bacterium]|nr:GAF domain-containing protein [Planctomycetota bacterium]
MPAEKSQVELLLAMSSEARSSDSISRALQLATDFFGLEFGIVSRVDGDDYEIEFVHQPDDAGLQVGQRFSLGNTYCAITLAAQDVISIEEMRHSAHSGHPCYQAFGLESYLGVPLVVDGKVYGTLNFSSPQARDREWSETERQLVRLLARWVESSIVNGRLNDQLSSALTDLDHANAELADRVENLDAFARAASHDLQAPLRKIVQLGNVLAEELGADLPEEAAQYLGLMQGCAATLKQLVQDLLEFGRSNNAEISAAPVELQACVSHALRHLEIPMASANAQVSCGDLPTVMAHESMVAQVLQNLIGNGIKFRRADVPPQIHIEAREEGGFAHVSVEDNGIGIEPQFLEIVFKPFRRLHQASSFEGSGLGLAICANIISRHGGTIRAENAEGGGARVTFTLPLATDD